MSLLSYAELVSLVYNGVINAPLENINGTSIDITLDEIIMLEGGIDCPPIIDLKNKQSIKTTEYLIPGCGHWLKPNEFILASSAEIFNLPNNISAEYKLKSSLARCGLQHMLACWCEPGWTNSKLTLELKNVTQRHTLVLKPGMKIGQMVFWKSKTVPKTESYQVKGQYNNQTSVTNNKGVR